MLIFSFFYIGFFLIIFSHEINFHHGEFMSVQKVVQGLSNFLPMGAMAAGFAAYKRKENTTLFSIITVFQNIIIQRSLEKLAFSFFKHYISKKPEYKVMQVGFSIITSFALIRIFSGTHDNFKDKATPAGVSIIGETGFHLLTSGKYAEFCYPIAYKLFSK